MVEASTPTPTEDKPEPEEKSEARDNYFMNPRVMVKQSEAMVATNIAQCQEISLFVSKLTCDSLMSKIQETMPAEDAALFKKSDEPFIDIYGRSTFVYI